MKPVISAILFLLSFSAWALPQNPEARELRISEHESSVVLKKGVKWFSLSDLPATVSGIPDGVDLGRRAFKSVVMAPDNLHAALVVSDSNHEWVAILGIADRKVTAGHLLYGGGVQQLLWSPDGKKLLIEANEASGLPGMVVLALANPQKGIRVNALLLKKVNRPMILSNPAWGADSDSLTFDASSMENDLKIKVKLGPGLDSLSVLPSAEALK
jgi:hypothetical protein